MAVKLAHFARNVKIVTRTSGVSFTGVLAINNCPHCKLFVGVTLECFTRYWSLWSFAWPTNSLTSIHLGYKTNCEKCQGHHTSLELRVLKLKKEFRISIKICEEFLEWWILTFAASSMTDVPQWCPTERHLTAGGLSDSYNDLYGEAPPQRFPFFSLQVYERVGILKRPKRDDRFI